MIKRIFVFSIIMFFVVSYLNGCILDPSGGGSVAPKKDEEGSEPDEPPPPPPPPPDDSSTDCGMLLASDALTLENIANMVLQGEYGCELQHILAAEVSRCINEMQVQEVVSISKGTDGIIIRESGRDKRSIMFNPFYIAEYILAGSYGNGPRLALHDLMRSDSERSIK